MGAYSNWALVVISIWIVSLIAAVPIPEACIFDTQCDDGYFCGGKLNNRCELCYECAKIGRDSNQAIDGPACARNSQDCGACLDGYEDLSGSCVKAGQIWIKGNDVTTLMEQRPAAPEKNEGWLIALLIFVIVILVIALVVGTVWYLCFKSVQIREYDLATEPGNLTASTRPSTEPVCNKTETVEEHNHTVPCDIQPGRAVA